MVAEKSNFSEVLDNTALQPFLNDIGGLPLSPPVRIDLPFARQQLGDTCPLDKHMGLLAAMCIAKSLPGSVVTHRVINHYANFCTMQVGSKMSGYMRAKRRRLIFSPNSLSRFRLIDVVFATR